jgi:hypothetical protein
MSEFLGSIWFGVMLALAGYLVGNVLPIRKLMDMFKSK